MNQEQKWILATFVMFILMVAFGSFWLQELEHSASLKRQMHEIEQDTALDYYLKGEFDAVRIDLGYTTYNQAFCEAFLNKGYDRIETNLKNAGSCDEYFTLQVLGDSIPTRIITG